MKPDEIALTFGDILGAVERVAAKAVSAALGSEEAAKVREQLTTAATCVTLEEVAELWRVTPRAASAALKKYGVPTVDLGHRSPRYQLSQVLAAVDAASGKTKARIVNFPQAA